VENSLEEASEKKKKVKKYQRQKPKKSGATPVWGMET